MLQMDSKQDYGYGHRQMVGNTSAANSKVSGAGVQAVTAFTTYTVNVYAYDGSSVYRGIGGDVFIIRIENQCSKGSSFV